MVLPKSYKDELILINDRGAEALIYADADRNKAYKIYRFTFGYNEEKFKAFASVNNPNAIVPKSPLSLEDDEKTFIGYEMDYDDGIALPFVRNVSMDDLIKAALEISKTVKDISNAHFLMWDPNIENITFSNCNFKFVDAYTYAYLKRMIASILYRCNIMVVNKTVLRGLISLSYKKIIMEYLASVSSRDLRLYERFKITSDTFVYDVLSLLQEVTNENDLDEVKLKIMTPIKMHN